MSYSDLLRDPRWQRLRLEVMQRADFKCEHCGSETTTLNVHHTYYRRGRKPWEYDHETLRCLCEPCHKKEHPEKQVVPPRAVRVPTYTPEVAALMARKEAIHAEIPTASIARKDELVRDLMEVAIELRVKHPTWKALR